VPLAAFVAVTIAGCSSGGPAAAPAPASQAGRSSAAPATPAAAPNANALKPLSAVDPCSLVGQVTPMIELTKVKTPALKGARSCNWEAASMDADLTSRRFALNVNIYARSSLKKLSGLPRSEDAVTTYPSLAGHPARLVKNAGTGECYVSIGVTSSSRVDVTAFGGALGANCAGVMAAAPLIAGQLPGGRPGGTSAAPADRGFAPAGPLAAVAPCSLGTGIKVKLTKTKTGQNYCQWVYASSKNISTAQIEGVEVDLVYAGGVGAIAHSGSLTMVALPAVAGHPARLVTETGTNSCFVALGVSGSSRVDVGVDDYLGNAGLACKLAQQVAPAVAAQLPAAS
jgi:hypothetical protein